MVNSEPDAYARTGMGIAMIAAALVIVLFEWIFPLPMYLTSIVATFLIFGIVMLWVGIWEEKQIIKEERNGQS